MPTVGIAEVIASDQETIRRSKLLNGLEIPPGAVLIRHRSQSARGGALRKLAVPFNMNSYKVPVPGELVLTIAGPDGTASAFGDERIYYADILSSYHSVNENKYPNYFHRAVTSTDASLSAGIQNTNRPVDANDNISFQARDIIPIQPYEGDMILQDRHGSAIRFSGTVLPAAGYQQRPFWRSDNASDPIVTISCGLKPGGNY